MEALPGKLDDIDPKRWAGHGVKPIRNVPKEFQAQHREILSDLFGDHAEAARQSDLVNQRRLEKVLILLQILLHAPPERSGIPGENPSTAKARLARHLHVRYHKFDLGDFEALDPTKQNDGNAVTRRRLAGGSPPKANQTIQADLVIEAVKAGNLGKAVTLIDSNGVAPITQDVFDQIGALLNPQEPRPISVCIADHARQPPNLRNTEVAAMLRKAPKRSARDAYGWTYEHLQQLLGHSQGLTGLKEFLNRLNGGGATSGTITDLNILKVTPLLKGTKGKSDRSPWALPSRDLHVRPFFVRKKRLHKLLGLMSLR